MYPTPRSPGTGSPNCTTWPSAPIWRSPSAGLPRPPRPIQACHAGCRAVRVPVLIVSLPAMAAETMNKMITSKRQWKRV